MVFRGFYCRSEYGGSFFGPPSRCLKLVQGVFLLSRQWDVGTESLAPGSDCHRSVPLDSLYTQKSRYGLDYLVFKTHSRLLVAKLFRWSTKTAGDFKFLVTDCPSGWSVLLQSVGFRRLVKKSQTNELFVTPQWSFDFLLKLFFLSVLSKGSCRDHRSSLYTSRTKRTRKGPGW